MLRGSENCARTPPAALLVEPEASWSRSTRTTSGTPASARWKAMLAPITPPPTTATLAAPLEDRPGRRRVLHPEAQAVVEDQVVGPVPARVTAGGHLAQLH